MDWMDNSGLAVDGIAVEREIGGGANLEALMDELAHGVLVVSLAGRLLHANQVARHELARGSAIVMQNRLLQAAQPEASRQLNDAMARAADRKRSLVTLAATAGPALTVAVVPLRQPDTMQPLRVALIFSRPSVCESLMLCFFARSHGLTNSEEQVLGILCQGYSAPEAAAQLKVAVSTVRSHVRSLCAKTGSSGMRELVSRVAMLPPVAPALCKEALH